MQSGLISDISKRVEWCKEIDGSTREIPEPVPFLSRYGAYIEDLRVYPVMKTDAYVIASNAV